MLKNRIPAPLFLFGLACVLARPLPCRAQQQPAPANPSTAQQPQADSTPAHPEAEAAEAEPKSVFPHPGDQSPIWVSAQANGIFQAHPPFPAAYSGPNSFQTNYQKGFSRVYTLYTGLRLSHSVELLADVEEASGSGMSNSLGLAGYSNLDVVRIPGEGLPLSEAPYLARVEYHEVFALSKKRIPAERGPMSGFAELPERRLEIRAGLFDTVDFFDQNSVGSDSHMQFMNWAIDNNGAYDYAADTRGYTWGVETEFQAKNFAFRAGEMLMPKVANGIDMQWNLRKAHADNFEFELRKGLLPKKDGTIRILSYINHADMGIYRDAIAQYEAGVTKVPDITDHAPQETIKYGFGVNLEQEIARNFTAYARWGWNNGKTESFCYTEMDSTVQVGLGASGHAWHRNHDRAGVAFETGGISKDHQEYLRDGGRGFILGDNPDYPNGVPPGGALSYGRENIEEAYYTMHLWRGLYMGPDVQRFDNPGYNRDRGPVFIGGFRVHLEL